MHIKELVLKNFKSFSYASIPFKSGFQVIVGPNGSGKSNIIDALIFAFGSTSLKRLRVDKTANLVNQSAKEKKARVRVVFTHEGKDIDIVREIDESGKSVCLLDGKRKALNEITSFLEETGITSDGYNTVQQGDVTKIINMNPEERRKIVEDISGISLFDERKKEAQDNLDKVNKRLDKVSIALNERKPYVEQLSVEREAALKFKELDSLELVYSYNLYNKQIDEYNNDLFLEEARISKLTSDIDVKNQNKKELMLKISECENKLENINNDLIAHSEKVQTTVGRELSENKANKEIIQNNLNLRKENIEYLETENQKLSVELSELKKEEQLIKTIIKDQEVKLKQKTKTRDDLKEQIKKHSKEFEGVRKIQEELYSKLSSINKDITQKQESFFSNKTKISAYEFQKETIEKQSKEKEAENKALQERKKEIESIISKQRKEITNLENEISKLLQKLKTEEKEKEELQKIISQKIIELNGFKKDLSFSSLAQDKREKLKSTLKKHKSFVGFLDDFVTLEKSQKSIYSNYVVLKDSKEISTILKEIGEHANINFVVLTTLGTSEKELSKKFSEHTGTKTKAQNIDGFYFDGFCYKKILIKDTKELESKIASVEKELEKANSKILENNKSRETSNKEHSEKNKELTDLQVKLNTNIAALDEIVEKIDVIKSASTNTSTLKTIAQNLGQIKDETISLDNILITLRKEKQEVETKLKSLNLGAQTTLRDEYDSLVSETNTLEQSLISKNAEEKTLKEKIESKSNLIEINNSKLKELQKQITSYNDQIIDIDNKINDINKKFQAEDQKKQDMFQKKSSVSQESSMINQQIHEIDVSISEINLEINDARLNINTLKSKVLQADQNIKMLEGKDKYETVEFTIEQLYSKLRTIKRDKNALGNINFNAIDSYEKLAKEYEEIIQKFDIIVAEKAQVEAMLDEINLKKTTIFMDCFNKVNDEFKKVISKMSNSLKGSLELLGDDPLTSQLIINIIKNGQKKNIDVISGGEKTITALAVIFAVHAYKKSPFYILDEVDASLDDQNSENLLNYVKELSKSVAVICITHNSTIVSGADQIIGVTLKGNSSVIGLDMAR